MFVPVREFHLMLNNIIQTTGLWLINQLSFNSGYQSKKNIVYGPENRNLLDYYEVSSPEPGRPLVLFYHGGDWSSGSKDIYPFVADALCRKGFDVIIPDYRLYPEVRFDSILDDAVKACHWALKEADDRPLIIMGHSAGAQLGALVCLNKELDVGGTNKRDLIKGFVGMAGPYDFYPFSDKHHYDLFAPEDDYPKSQPVNYVRPDSPPMYLLHGRDDQRVRRGHSKSLMEKLQSVGAKAEREVYDNMGHVEIIRAFAPFFRSRSPVLFDVASFIKKCIS